MSDSEALLRHTIDANWTLRKFCKKKCLIMKVFYNFWYIGIYIMKVFT